MIAPYRARETRALDREEPFFPRVGDVVRVAPDPRENLLFGRTEYASRVGRVVEIFPSGVYGVRFFRALPGYGVFLVTELQRCAPGSTRGRKDACRTGVAHSNSPL